MHTFETSNTKEGHLALLEKINGLRMDIMEYAKVPPGWVIDARTNDPLWDHMVPEVFPLKPKPAFLGISSKAAKEAQAELSRHRLMILEDPQAFPVVIPDGDGGWEMGWVRPTDLLTPNADDLLTESLNLIGKNNDLSRAKEAAYKVHTGEWDLH